MLKQLSLVEVGPLRKADLDFGARFNLIPGITAWARVSS